MSLLPSNSTNLERVLEVARDYDLDPDIIRGVADSARCPASFLPWLGWALKVEGWEAAYTDEQRRELIHEAIPVHKTKGTVGAIRRVLKAVRVNAEFKEWHQIPNAAPYTFQVTAWANENRPGEGSIISPQLEERLRALVDAAKNERSHYNFRLGARFDGGLMAANAARLQGWVSRSAELQPILIPPSQQALGFATAARLLVRARRSADAQSIPVPPSEQVLGLASASQLQQVQRHSAEVEAMPVPAAAQVLWVAGVTNARSVARWSVDVQSLPINNETVLLAANAASTRVVVRVTMEAVL